MSSSAPTLSSDLPQSTVDAFNGDTLAARTFLEKYALRDDDGNLIELLPAEMWKRVAVEIASVEDDRLHWAEEFNWLLSDWRFVPGGRILHGAGSTHEATLLNCYFRAIEQDSIEGIFDWSKYAARTYATGGGMGVCLGPLRPEGADVNNTAKTSSGAWSFSELFSTTTGVIGQHGRRGALMITCPVDHPDVEQFVKMKGEDLDSVRYANISVKLSDEFMEAVRDGESFTLRWQNDDGVDVQKVVDARKLWDEIVTTAHASAEPGLMFWDNIKRESPSEYCAPVEGTNPCWTGETEVWTVDGPQRFDELAKTGDGVEVLTEDDDGNLTIRTMRNPRLTGTKNIMEIELDNGHVLRLTPNHKLYTYEREEVEAKDVQVGESLASVYRYNANQKGYKRLTNGVEAPLEHHVMVESTEGRRPNYPAEHCHHINGIKDDNRPENLEIIDASEHNSAHMKGSKNPMSGVWDERNPLYGADVSGENNPRYRDDVSTDKIRQLRETGMSYTDIAEEVGCSKYTVQKRLGYERPANHRVVDVRTTNETVDVYNGTVDDTHRYFVKVGEDEAVLSRNCGEQPLESGGACCLGHVNLSRLVLNPFTEDADVNWDELEEVVLHGVRFLDDVLDYNLDRHPHEDQRQQSRDVRRIGLGVTGLADMLAKLEIKYDSPEAIEFVDELMERIKINAYEASVELARIKGSFPLFDEGEHLERPFVKRLPERLQEDIKEYGLRNVCILTVAPVGSGSVIAGTSSGVEPIYQLKYKRRSESLTEEWHDVAHPLVQEYADRMEDLQAGVTRKRVLEDLPDYFVVSHDIDPFFRVKMQATMQKHVDSAISSTINLDKDVEVDTVKDIYMEAWKQGCKGITVYREGAREGILISEESDGKSGEEVTVSGLENGESGYQPPEQRPQRLGGETYKIKTPSGNMYTTITEHGGRPFEVFMHIGRSGGFTHAFTEALARVISLHLRTGGDIKDVIDQLIGIRGPEAAFTEDGVVYSIPDALAKALDKHLEIGIEDVDLGLSPECSQCHAPMVMENGCATCYSCGHSKCT